MDMVVTAEGAYFQKILSHILLLFLHLHQTACAIVYNMQHIKTFSKPKVTVTAEIWLPSRLLGQNVP